MFQDDHGHEHNGLGAPKVTQEEPRDAQRGLQASENMPQGPTNSPHFFVLGMQQVDLSDTDAKIPAFCTEFRLGPTDNIHRLQVGGMRRQPPQFVMRGADLRNQ